MELDDLRNPQRVALQAQEMGMVHPAGAGLPGPRRHGASASGCRPTRENAIRLLPPAPVKPEILAPAPTIVEVAGRDSTPDDDRAPGARATDKRRTTQDSRPATTARPRGAQAVRDLDLSCQPTWTESPHVTTNRAVAEPPGARRMLRLRVGLRRHRDGAVVLRCAAGPAAGHRPQVVRRHGGGRGRGQGASAAERGDILDRNGIPLADSIKGKMVVADPTLTADDGPEIARLLSQRLAIDYFKTLAALRGRTRAAGSSTSPGACPAPWPANLLAELDEAGYEGVSLRDDPIRAYPAGDVAANLLGFMGTDEPLGGFERTFDAQLAGTDGAATWQSNSRKGNRIPLRREHPRPRRRTARRCAPRSTATCSGSPSGCCPDGRAVPRESGVAIVMDSRTGEMLALADVPTFDANKPIDADEDDLGSRAINDTYEPGSVEKVLTVAVADRRRQGHPAPALRCPASLPRQDRVDRRLVRPRQHPAHAGRHHRQVLQHRHRARRRRVQPGRARDLPPALRPRAERPTSACAARRPASCPR